jgi:hypothetical protein
LLESADAMRREADKMRAEAERMRREVVGQRTTMMGTFTWSGPTLEQKADALLTKWKQARESDREGIQKELRGVLTEDFKARLGKHQKEIEQLEAQLKQLRDKLNLRTSKQDEIVDFRLQQLLREAQGLGWGTDNRATAPFTMAPTSVPPGPFSGSYIATPPVPPSLPAVPASTP